MPFHKNLTGDEAIHQIMYVQSSDPGAVGAGKFWLDTTGGASLDNGAILKQRDGTNTGWTTRCDLSALAAGALDGLSDVNAPTPGDGDVLTYDNGTGDWIAAPPTGGGSDVTFFLGVFR
jgi:hypothetical protein